MIQQKRVALQSRPAIGFQKNSAFEVSSAQLFVNLRITRCGGIVLAQMLRTSRRLVICAALYGFLGDAMSATADESVKVRQVQKINQQIRALWDESGLKPSQTATEGEWCRRVYLDILGRIPSVDELKAFLANKSARKRDELATSLLHDDHYTQEYARNWTTIWTNLLIGRTGGNDNNSLISRPGMQKYLRDSFARNTSYDELVYELVSSTGSTTPGEEHFNGATNFLIMKLDDNAIQATAKTSQLFLGMQVQCTQCHNHPFNDWKQSQFWQMNAFFRQTVALRRGTRQMRRAELANQDFGGEGSTPQEAELYYELRNGLLKTAYPVFVDGKPLVNRSGYLSDVDRREELAKLIVQSEYMDKAIINRMWGHFLGYGFTNPVDDMGPHNPPTHPELLDYLVAEFRSGSRDLKKLMRWIVLSEPYSLSSRTTPDNENDDPLLGELPKFTHFYLRQMRAEELYESLLVATQAHKTRGGYEEQEKAKREWLRQFSIAFGTDEGDETTIFNGTIPQALMMFNGDLIKQATSVKSGGFLSQLANGNLRPAQAIDYLFLAGLARRPSKQEVRAANALMQARAADRETWKKKYDQGRPKQNAKVAPALAALQDIWWAVLNSNEFILNH